MKYIGIDYGTKKVGIAVSDSLGSIAFPRGVLKSDKVLPSTLAGIIKDEEVDAIVIGESRNLQGGLNDVAHHAKELIAQLKELIGGDVVVYYEDERFTTKQARALPHEGAARGNISNKRGGVTKTTQADAQAAGLILQSFLDKQQNSS